MKKYLIYTLLALSLLSACKKNNSIAPANLPEQRVAAALAGYSNTLTGNSNGWKAILYPAGGGVYLFTMKFGTNNRVTMLSDLGGTASTTPLESSYILKLGQAPSIIFDTYSYIHLLADPDPSVAGGDLGNGLGSDFEFYFDKTVGDTIKLVGNRLGSKLMLVKASTPTDFTTFITGTSTVLNQLSTVRTYFKRVTIGTTDCELRIDPVNKAIIFSYLDTGGNLIQTTGSFYVDGSTNTMVFISPVVIGTTTITTIKGIVPDAANHIVGATLNGTSVQIREAIAPLKYDLTAAGIFYNLPSIDGSVVWLSDNGFTVDNVVDAYKVKTIPNFAFLVFFPKYNPAYDRLGFFLSTNAYGAYGPAIIPSFPANGKITFSYYGSFGTTPASIATIVTSTTNKIIDPNGYYVIKTSPVTYDIVNATDARAWMSFYED